MTTRRRRKRCETAEVPTGIDAAPPYPPRDAITALRVLGHDLVVRLDPARSEFRLGRAEPPITDVQLPMRSISGVHALLTRNGKTLDVTDLGSKNGIACARTWIAPGVGDYVRFEKLIVNVGDRFALGSVELLALDERTYQLIRPLTTYCGPVAHDQVEHALASILQGSLIALCSSPSTPEYDVLELARMLHAHSIRRDYPFTHLDALPKSKAAIERLCMRAGCGTIVLDLRQPFAIPPLFVEHLFSTRFHLATLVVARTIEELSTCFGESWLALWGCCKLGFPRKGWHRTMLDPQFEKV